MLREKVTVRRWLPAAQADFEPALRQGLTLNFCPSTSTFQVMELQAYVIMIKTEALSLLGKCSTNQATVSAPNVLLVCLFYKCLPQNNFIFCFK